MRDTALQELVRLSHLRWQRLPMKLSVTRIAPSPQLPWFAGTHGAVCYLLPAAMAEHSVHQVIGAHVVL
jgi:hypothetical protein